MSQRFSNPSQTESPAGLSEAEAGLRLRQEGFNELPGGRKRSSLRIVLDVFREPMFLMLIGAGTLYLVLGDKTEALMLLGFVFVIIGITFNQERRTTRALEALRDLTSPRARVIRDGRQRRIPGREVVRDDVVMLSEGDRVPADAVVLSAVSLSVDESLLTGESGPVRKTAAEGPVLLELDAKRACLPCHRHRQGDARPGGDDTPWVFSGSLVVQGQGAARVFGTGSASELGRIGKVLAGVETGDSRLQKETRVMVRNTALLGLGLSVLAVLLYGFTRSTEPDGWLHALEAGIALAMAVLPEEFPVVLTVFLALGAWRIAQRRVLTRRPAAVETLGSATVLCVDKTGTLTQNSMTVRMLEATDGQRRVEHEVCGTESGLHEGFHALVEFGVLAGQNEPFDPMERALKALGEGLLSHTEHIHRNWNLVREYPLSHRLLAVARVWESPDRGEYVIAAKGAPEAIADLCHMSQDDIRAIEDRVSAMAQRGLRVIAVARSRTGRGELPAGQHDFAFQFLGLVGFDDPVRDEVPAAVQECYDAGMRVVMVTGDHPRTAQNVARQIALKDWNRVLSGEELAIMDDQALAVAVGRCNVFARVVPEQKLRLVEALKASGEVVAMTGDGVNDAPALKSADIGLAMGGRGTDVAREAASLVLLDDDFSSIVAAVRMGRRIFDNLKKAMAYIFAIHVPIAGMSLLPVLFGWPLVLLPVHIVFLELIIDPACSIVFEAEAEEKDVMRRPPRRLSEPLFSARTIGLALLQGFSVLAIVLAVFLVTKTYLRDVTEARTLSFTTLIVANLGLILTNRSWSRTAIEMLRRPNAALWWVMAGALVFLGLVLYVPPLRTLFRFHALHPVDLLICLSAGAISILWFEILKLVTGRRQARNCLDRKHPVPGPRS